MLLNSESQKGQNSSSNDSSMKFSNKNKFQSFINYSVKKAKNHSKFYSMSLRNSKKMNSNPRINIIINNNNPINYANTPSSMYINSFSQEKKLKRTKSHDQNSTFVFTGDNQSNDFFNGHDDEITKICRFVHNRGVNNSEVPSNVRFICMGNNTKFGGFDKIDTTTLCQFTMFEFTKHNKIEE